MFFIVKEPSDNSSWNYYLLYNLSLVKYRIVGVFYIPELRYYGPVLDLDDNDLEKVCKDIFIPIDEECLLRSLAIICERCGWCCEEDAGSFLFEHELAEVKQFIGRKLTLPSKEVKLWNGTRVRIYLLDLEQEGRCIFYDVRTRSCRIHLVKPVICMVTYCARFAIDRWGRRYLREGTRQPDGSVRFRPAHVR